MPSVAYLSDGRLFVLQSGQEAREVQSAFAQQVMERQARTRDAHGWRDETGVWGNMGMAPPELGQWEMGEQRTPVRIQGAVAGDAPGQLYYILGVGNMGGLFEYSRTSDTERRLMHRNGFVARDIARNPQSGEVAISVRREDGTAGIQVGDGDGRFLRDVTVGDAVDECPSWIPGEGRRLIYQSAGVGRSEHGFASGISEYRLEQIDLDAQNIETAREEAGFDLLQPKLTADDTLYYIRRPYEPMGRQNASLWETIKDVFLFPFRLAVAIFHFLNFFAVLFSGKPLSTASGPRENIQDQRFRMVWGRMIDTKKAMLDARKNKTTGLVPKTWQLVRVTSTGEETVLAENVMSFDLCDDGLIYTDGTVIVHRKSDGPTFELGRDKIVEKVLVVDALGDGVSG